MVAGEIPGFLETVRLALRLNPTIYTTLPGTAQGLTYAITIVLLASISESLGQSVVLFLNRVRPRRFVLALSITTLSNVAGYLLWTLTIWSVGNLLAETNQPWSVVAVIVGLAYAPQILAFFELTPYLGNLIWGMLSLWSMIAIVGALHFGWGMETWQALLTSGLGWIVIQSVRRTIGRPILHLQRRLQRRAAGVPLEVAPSDVARLRRHPVRTWYTQLENRRRDVPLMPIRRKPRKDPNERNV